MPNNRKNKAPDGRGANRTKIASRHPLMGEDVVWLYPDPADYEADMGLLNSAWETHYGPLSDDFVPPFFYRDTDDDSLKVVEWPRTFRELLLEKYGLAEFAMVELRFQYICNAFLMEANVRGLQQSLGLL
ncbi:hypothetical protein JCM14076_32650 [Methylosoma difficile]